jgi:Calx-beta domain
VIEFASASYTVNEDGGTVTITVTRSGNTALTSSVNYFTANGSAIGASDYVAASGTLVFAPGETSKSVTILIIDDTVNEPNETFEVLLNSLSNADAGDPTTTTVTIVDNDKQSRRKSPRGQLGITKLRKLQR